MNTTSVPHGFTSREAWARWQVINFAQAVRSSFAAHDARREAERTMPADSIELEKIVKHARQRLREKDEIHERLVALLLAPEDRSV